MNHPFTGRELSAALSSCNSRSAPSLDGVGYGILLGLSERARELLLSLFNRMFSTSRFPPSWRDTLVSFVPKAGIDKFRPISLTSTVCKIFERLVQKRLEFLAENSSCIPANQFSFRRGDPLWIAFLVWSLMFFRGLVGRRALWPWLWTSRELSMQSSRAFS